MADTPGYGAFPETPQADLHKQIEDLRSDVGKMRDSISALLEGASEHASDFYDSSVSTAAQVGSGVKRQAQAISESVQENPVPITSAFVAGGIFGMLIGYAMRPSERHRRLF